jgi:hypothetical protein
VPVVGFGSCGYFSQSDIVHFALRLGVIRIPHFLPHMLIVQSIVFVLDGGFILKLC